MASNPLSSKQILPTIENKRPSLSLDLNASLHLYQISTTVCKKDSFVLGAIRTEHADHEITEKICENQEECTTPTSKGKPITEIPVCPSTPRKPPPKRRRQAPPAEGFFIPADLHLLPTYLQALFR